MIARGLQHSVDDHALALLVCCLATVRERDPVIRLSGHLFTHDLSAKRVRPNGLHCAISCCKPSAVFETQKSERLDAQNGRQMR